MSETIIPESKNCAVCNKPVNKIQDVWVHDGGGTVEQKCKNPSCNWRGGQFGKFSACPRCSDATQLVDDHSAQ